MYIWNIIRNDFRTFYEDIYKRLTSLKSFVDKNVTVYNDDYANRKVEIDKQFKPSYESIKKEYDELIAMGTERSLAFNQSNWLMQDEHIEGLKYDEYEHHNYMKETLLNSAIISTISIIEYGLKEYCELISIEKKYKIKPKHFESSQNYIGSYKNYLDLVANVEMESITANFNTIYQYRIIRNKIIHSLGKITKKEPKDTKEESENIDTLIAKYNMVTINHTGFISIKNPDFVFDLIKISLELFNKLFLLYEKKDNFKRLKESIDFFFSKIDLIDEISSEIKNQELLKIKYKSNYIFKGTKQEMSIYISESKQFNFEIFNPDGKLEEFQSEIESNKYFFTGMLIPYITYKKDLMDVKIYL